MIRKDIYHRAIVRHKLGAWLEVHVLVLLMASAPKITETMLSTQACRVSQDDKQSAMALGATYMPPKSSQLADC